MMKRLLALGRADSLLAGAAHAAPRITTIQANLTETMIVGDLQLVSSHGHAHRQYRAAPRQTRNHAYQPHSRHYHHAPTVQRGYSHAHYSWCPSRYKSYDRHNNPWRAYSGKVHQCRSPY